MINEAVSLSLDEQVATLTLRDEGRLNPLDGACVAGLQSGLQTVRNDSSARVLVITARGRGFSVGADLAEYQQRLTHPQAGEPLGDHVGTLMAGMNQVMLKLQELPIPVICAVNGVAAGGGAGLALAGDMVLAARSAYFYLPFIPSLGAVPDMGLTWRLPRALGAPRALGLALSGHKLSAVQAESWGLIWACVDDEQLNDATRRLAQQLAQIPTEVVLEARAIFAAAERNTLEEQLALERERQMIRVGDASFVEGVRAFAERRAPRFRQR